MTAHKTYESHYSREANERDKKTKEFLRNVYPDRLYFPIEDVPVGVEYRWVREEIRGQKDISNVTLMCKQGWTPVPFSRHPHFLADTSWFKSEDPTVIRIDGLILCERPIEYGEIERESLRQQNAHALQAVNWTISQDHERDRKVYQNETRAPRVSSRSTQMQAPVIPETFHETPWVDSREDTRGSALQPALAKHETLLQKSPRPTLTLKKPQEETHQSSGEKAAPHSKTSRNKGNGRFTKGTASISSREASSSLEAS